MELNRIGETRFNSKGSKMWITEYKGYNDIMVEFKDGFITKANYQQFCKGNVRNPYDKSVYNIGYIGEGSYKTGKSINGKSYMTKQYKLWTDILTRCYSSGYHDKFPTYKNVTCCKKWLNYQNFAKWYDENYYEVKGHKMHLDKDILHKGNKIYSPNTCVFVPNNINVLFTKSDASRGKTPLGVSKNSKGVRALCNDGCGKLVCLGTYETELEAFNSYKIFKENLIKSIANTYKNQIPQKLYEAMYRYEVEIID